MLEQRILRDLRKRGFTEPTTQLSIHDQDGSFLARVDLAFEPEMVVIEGDSLGWHLNRRSFSKDPTVRRRLRMLGWFVMEITNDMLELDAERTYRDLRDLLEERSASNSSVRPEPTPPSVDDVPAEGGINPPGRSDLLARNSIMDDLERYFWP